MTPAEYSTALRRGAVTTAERTSFGIGRQLDIAATNKLMGAAADCIDQLAAERDRWIGIADMLGERTMSPANRQEVTVSVKDLDAFRDVLQRLLAIADIMETKAFAAPEMQAFHDARIRQILDDVARAAVSETTKEV